MRQIPILIVAMMLLAVSTVHAQPPSSADRGLQNACQNGADRPCQLLGIIEDTTVGAGETETYSDDDYTAEGTVVVESGGTVVVENATVRFEGTSDGFIVKPGGTLTIHDSFLVEAGGGSDFGIDIQPAATFVLERTEVTGGSGLQVASEDALITDNLIEEIPVALRLMNVSLHIEANHFRNNTVAVNQTGGSPTLEDNFFEGGQFCVRDWRTNPTIVANLFRGCHVGIWHEQSESAIRDNDMEDETVPPGGGIMVIDTESPIIEGNRISHYGVGILVQNARAFIRNNTIHDNVADGVRVVANSAPMDITGNEIFDNGRHGIALEQVDAIMVEGNFVHDNGFDGIFAANSTDLTVTGNTVVDNPESGIRIHFVPSIAVTSNIVTGNGHDGIQLGGGSDQALIDGNHVAGSGRAGILVAGAEQVQVQENVVETSGAWGIAIGQASDGMFLDENQVNASTLEGIIVLSRVNMTYNDVTNGAFDGITFLAGAEQSVLHGGSSESNAGGGLILFGAKQISVSDFVSKGNQLAGVRVDHGQGTFVEVNASHNGQAGFSFVTNAGPNDTANISVLQDVRAFENHGQQGFGFGIINEQGQSMQVSGSWFQGNPLAGVQNDDPNVTLDARNNYWGSPNGPTHADNPGGDGDAVVGNVLYHPFLTGPPSPFL